MSKPKPIDLHAIVTSLQGGHLNGELAKVSDRFAPLLGQMERIPVDRRAMAWEFFWLGQDDGPDLAKAVAEFDPSAPPEEGAVEPPRFATAADLRRLMKDTRWAWDLWIPTGAIFGIAALEGCGKTRFALDLHKRAWFGTEWPDGTPVRIPAGRPALWLCSDAQQLELVDALGSYGLPDESLVFPTPADEPFGGDNIDDPELVREGGVIEQAIEAVQPWCLVIDTLTNSTSRNLSDQQVMKVLGDPLKRIAQKYNIPVALVLHVAKDGGVLGRRIRGLTRTIIKLENPAEAEEGGGDGRLRLWVEKSYAAKPLDANGKPLVLGVTMKSEGNAYDNAPPARAAMATKAGRPSKEGAKAEEFILSELDREDGQKYTDLCRKFVETMKGNKSTFSRIKDKLIAERKISASGGPDTGRQMTLHLINWEEF